jgi:two-component system, OmpR family, response regulator
MTRIMLVDDEPDIRTIGELSLVEVGGMSVVAAASGAEALAIAPGERLDLILLDVMMPEMDGPSVLTCLREDARTARIPVVFMTAKVQRHEVQRYLALGAAGVIAKPFDPLTLPDQVRSVLAASHA